MVDAERHGRDGVQEPAQHAHEDEILNSYKVLDKDKGRIQIPVARAMELIAQEHQGKPGKEWVPITDTYLEGAAFAASPAPAAEDNGISVENAPEERRGAKPAPSAEAPAGKGAKGGSVSTPAQNSAEGKGAMQGVSYIQRLATRGGVAPASDCTAQNKGTRQVVQYQADYVFWTAK